MVHLQATHSVFLAENPEDRGPGDLQSMGVAGRTRLRQPSTCTMLTLSCLQKVCKSVSGGKVRIPKGS